MRSTILCCLVAAAGVVVIAACSDDRPPATEPVSGTSSSSSSGSSGAVIEGGAGDAKPEADLCAPVEQTSQVVGEQEIPGATPTPSGGALVPGLYVLNEMRLYGRAPNADAGEDPPAPGPTGTFGQVTLRITPSSLRFIAARGTDAEALPASAPRVVTYTSAGTALQLTEACTTNTKGSALPYSVLDAFQVAFFVEPNRLEVFLKQQ